MEVVRARVLAVRGLVPTIVEADRSVINRFLDCRDPRAERLGTRLQIIRNPIHGCDQLLARFRRLVPRVFLLAPATRYSGEVGSFSMHEALRWARELFGEVEEPGSRDWSDPTVTERAAETGGKVSSRKKGSYMTTTIGSVIKQLRKRAGLTQAELAAAAGYKSAEAITQIEAETRNADPERLPRMAAALKTDARYLTILAMRATFPRAMAAIVGEPEALTDLPAELSSAPLLQLSRAAQELALQFDTLDSADQATIRAMVSFLLNPVPLSRLSRFGRCA
jgi:transcriptional regulator with XRE-family HTH domain